MPPPTNQTHEKNTILKNINLIWLPPLKGPLGGHLVPLSKGKIPSVLCALFVD